MNQPGVPIRWELSVTIGGQPIAGVVHGSFSTTNCFSADSFSLTFAIGAAPFQDMTFWSSLQQVEVNVAAQSAETGASLVVGMIDSLVVNPVNGTAVVEGRDLSASMIDAYHQGDFVNQTAAEVVQAIAANHGLQAAVTATTGYVGRYFGDGYTQLSLGQYSRIRSDWDLVVELARENNYDAFVQGDTLVFQPASVSGPGSVQIDISDLLDLRIEQALAIDTAAAARVQSWNSMTMASSDASSGAAGGQAYLFAETNLTPQQASNLASRYSAELSRLSTVASFDMPWDLSLSPRTVFQLSGTNSSFDGTYRIESIERVFGARSGSRQSVRAIPAAQFTSA